MKTSYLFILGKTPKLSVYELKQFFNDTDFVAQHPEFCVIESKKELDGSFLSRLGGCIAFGKVFSDTPEDFLSEKFRDRTSKVSFGISTFGTFLKQERKDLLLSVKKALKKAGIRPRFVNKDFANVTAPQVIGEKLIEEGSLLLCAVDDQGKRYFSEALAVQDINAYSARDFDKPFRDAEMGMLPPKLAQMMVNFATQGSLNSKKQMCVFDPFCGSGTILMEAMLFGFDVLGSDISDVSVSGTKCNIVWLEHTIGSSGRCLDVFIHDAKTAFRGPLPDTDICIATEGYLGPALRSIPLADVQKRIFRELETLYRSFFQNISRVLKKGARLCITFPFFQSNPPVYFPYERYIGSQFSVISPSTKLLYSRPDQRVGREIAIFEKR